MTKNVTDRPEQQVLDSIKQSILTGQSNTPIEIKDVVDLAIDIWRLDKKLYKVKDKLNEDENKSLDNSLDRLRRFVKKNDIEVIDYTGQKYNDGMNLDVLQFEKEPGLKHPIVFQTHEPAVSHLGKLYRKAKVIVHE